MTAPELPAHDDVSLPDPSGELALEKIRGALHGLQFGSVQIIVHDGFIVQIDRTEKQRFPPGTLNNRG